MTCIKHFKHFASKNQLLGLSISGTLVENGLIYVNDLPDGSTSMVKLFKYWRHVSFLGTILMPQQKNLMKTWWKMNFNPDLSKQAK